MDGAGADATGGFEGGGGDVVVCVFGATGVGWTVLLGSVFHAQNLSPMIWILAPVMVGYRVPLLVLHSHHLGGS